VPIVGVPFDLELQVCFIWVSDLELMPPFREQSYGFVTDLNGAINKKAEKYFLGSIVVVVPDKNGLFCQRFGATLCRICV
jgi:hypothetical protein